MTKGTVSERRSRLWIAVGAAWFLQGGCFHGVREFGEPKVHAGREPVPGEAARQYECRAAKHRIFDSSSASLTEIAKAFRENLNFVFDFREDAVGGRRCFVDAPFWYHRCLLPDVCYDELVSTQALDGAAVPILGNTSICLNVAVDPAAPWADTRDLYAMTAKPLGTRGYGPDPYATPDFDSWYHPGHTGYVPYGFVGMDLCWAARMAFSLSADSFLGATRWAIASGGLGLFGGSDTQGMRGLPAMVCNPTWLAQWMQFADRTGAPWGGPDGFVTAVPGSSSPAFQDALRWWELEHISEPPPEWWWNRNGDTAPGGGPGFTACADYVDGWDTEEDPPEECTPRDFDTWNTIGGEYHPDGYEYISAADMARWGGFSCPIDRLGIAGAGDIYGEPLPGLGWLAYVHRGDFPGEKLYFAPGNRWAFCGNERVAPSSDPASAPSEQVPMLPSDWVGNSSLVARWIDVGGRPALRFDVKLGAEMDAYIRLGWAVMWYSVTDISIHITIQPRVCGDLRPADFCVHKDNSGNCAHTLGPTTDALCGHEFRTDRYFPDAEDAPVDAEDRPTAPESDSAGRGDTAPEPLVLGNNNLLFDLEVTAEVNRDRKPIWCWDPISAFVCPGINYYADGKLEDAATAQAAAMFNNLARVLYFGMRNEEGGFVETGWDMGAAAHYLRRWFWWPAILSVPDVDATRAPDPSGIEFTDVRWKAGESNVTQFEFTWDADVDGHAEEEDNCPRVANSDQYDMDDDCVGDSCESDRDGDGCCEGCAGQPGAAECICGGQPGDVERGCDVEPSGSTCHDDDPSWGSMRGPLMDIDRDGIPADCDRNDDGDAWDDGDDLCPWSWSLFDLDYDPFPDDGRDPDGAGNACDEDDDDDGCADPIECDFPGYEALVHEEPCGDFACVNGQCRTETADRRGDNADLCPDAFHGTCPTGETCVWHPTAGGEEEPGAFWCEERAAFGSHFCETIHPPGGYGRGVVAPGFVEDLFESEHLWHGPLTASPLSPCGPTSRPDCCPACTEPVVYVLDGNADVVGELHPAEVAGRPVEHYDGMDVAVVRDVDGNGIHDIAISLPYATDENGVPRGAVDTFDGGTLALLRTRYHSGAFGSELSRVGFGLAATVEPLVTVASGSPVLDSVALPSSDPAGVSVMDRWATEMGLVRGPQGTRGTFAAELTAIWMGDGELAFAYSPICRGVTNKGCLDAIDPFGRILWHAEGWQAGNQFGASVDSDGTYLVIGVPGFNRGTGGLVRVVEIASNRGWNLTVRNGVTDLGRYVAIARAPDGPRVIAYAKRRGLPVVLEMDLRGQLTVEWAVPEGWEVIGLVSPSFDDGTTTDLYAIVYRTPDGWVMHERLRAAARAAR